MLFSCRKAQAQNEKFFKAFWIWKNGATEPELTQGPEPLLTEAEIGGLIRAHIETFIKEHNRAPQQTETALLRELALKEAEMAQERMDYAEQTRRLITSDLRSETDELTGLLNRYGLKRAMKQIWASAERNSHPVSLIVFDMDQFKAINEHFGHSIGDVALKKLGELLAAQAREMDVVARYGGEEFVIVLPHANEQEAFSAAERFRNNIQRELKPYLLSQLDDLKKGEGEEWIKGTISAGVSTFDSKNKQNPQELFKQADEALNVAKKIKGKNTTVSAGKVTDEERRRVNQEPKGGETDQLQRIATGLTEEDLALAKRLLERAKANPKIMATLEELGDAA